MTFQYDASHHQHELECEAEHERLVRAAHRRTPQSRLAAHKALGLGIVGLGLALGGDSACVAGPRNGPDRIRWRSRPATARPVGCGHASNAHHRPTPFTGDAEADRYLVQRAARAPDRIRARPAGHRPEAFSGPLVLRQRLGHLDAARIAATDPRELEEVFRTPPAIHRFPASMAGKVEALCQGDRRRLRQRCSPRLERRCGRS